MNHDKTLNMMLLESGVSTEKKQVNDTTNI